MHLDDLTDRKVSELLKEALGEIKKGDRVELVAMPNDPCPISVGSRGTVTEVQPIDWGDKSFVQLWVKWDNGRSLSPILPPDRLRAIRGDELKLDKIKVLCMDHADYDTDVLNRILNIIGGMI